MSMIQIDPVVPVPPGQPAADTSKKKGVFQRLKGKLGWPEPDQNQPQPPSLPSKNELENKRNIAAYETRKARTNFVLAELGKIGGADTEIAEVDAGLAKAEVEKGRGDYTAALKILNDFNFGKKLEAARVRAKDKRNKAMKAEAQMGKLAPKLVKKVEDLREAVRTGPFSDTERDRLLRRFDAANSVLREEFSARPNDEAGRRAWEANLTTRFDGVFNPAKQEVDQSRQMCEAAKTKVEVGLKAASDAFLAFRSENPTAILADSDRTFEIIRAQADDREFLAAVQSLDDFNERFNRTKEAWIRDKQSWETRFKPRLDVLAKEAEAQLEMSRVVTTVMAMERPYPGETVESLKTLKQRLERGEISFADARKEFGECQAAVDTNRVRLSKFAELNDRRDDAIVEVDDALKGAEGAIETLCDTLAALTSPIVTPADAKAALDRMLADIKAKWELRLKQSIDETSLGKDEMLREIQALAENATAACRDRGRFGIVLREIARDKLERVATVWEADIDELAQFHVAAAAEQAHRLRTARSAIRNAPNDVELERQRRVLADDMGRTRALLDKNRSVNANGRQDLLYPVSQALTALKSEIEKHKNEADYGKARDACEAELKQLELDAASRPAAELQGLQGAAASLIQKINDLKTVVIGKNEAGQTVITVAYLRKSFAKSRERLKKKELVLYMGKAVKDLEGELKELEKGLSLETKLPRDIHEDLAGWTRRYLDTQKDAFEANRNHAKFDEDIAAAATSLKKVKNAPNWVAKKETELKRLKDSYYDQDSRRGCRDRLTRFVEDIAGVNAAPRQAEQDTVAIESAAQLNRAEWEGLYKDFEGRLKDGAWESKPKEELGHLLKKAKAQFEADGNLVGAIQWLDAAKRRAAFYEKYPDGNGAAARAALPEAFATWKSSLGILNASMGELAAEVQALEGLSVPHKKKVADQITSMKALLAHSLDRPINLLTAPGQTAQQRAAGREAALRMVQTMLGYFEKDPRFRALGLNPLLPALSQAVTAQRLSLLKLQKTLLITV